MNGGWMEPDVAFGDVLKALRKQKGFSQEFLAQEANVERNYVSLLERGKNNPTIKIVFKLATALEIEASELMVLVQEKIKQEKKSKKLK